MTRIHLVLTMVVLAFTCGLVSAQQLTSRPNNNRANREERLARQLGLTSEQKVQIRNVNQKTRLALREAQQRFRRTRTELDEAIYGESVSEDQLREKIQAVVEAQAEITKAQALREYAVRRILTPEQLTRFRALRKRAAERRRKRINTGPRNRRVQRRGQRERPIDQR